MAKLSARGRTCLLSMVKEESVTDSDAGVIWRRQTVQFMSDRHILQKLDVKFAPIEGMEHVKDTHSYGWKDKGLAKPDMNPAAFREIMIQRGYTESV